MMSDEKTAYVVAESLRTLLSALEPRHDRDRILILRCTLALAVAEIYKLTDVDRVTMELHSLAKAMRDAESKILSRKGKLDA